MGFDNVQVNAWLERCGKVVWPLKTMQAND